MLDIDMGCKVQIQTEISPIMEWEVESEGLSSSLSLISAWISLITCRLCQDLISLPDSPAVNLHLSSFCTVGRREKTKTHHNHQMEVVHMDVSFSGTNFLTNKFCKHIIFTYQDCTHKLGDVTCRKHLTVNFYQFGTSETVVQDNFMLLN